MNSDQHQGPARNEPLSPQTEASPSHAERALTLCSLQRTGALSTLDPQGYPHGAYVTFALDGSSPVFLISNLATHTQHLQKDPRASLLVHESVASDPLANSRVTLVGECAKINDTESAKKAFLQKHPQSSYYVDFKDFSFYKLTVSSIRYIGGYGRMSWVDVDSWQKADPDPLAQNRDELIQQLAANFAEGIVTCTRVFTRATNASDVTLTGIDRYGVELSVMTEAGPRPARIAFQQPVTTPEQAKQALADLIDSAQSAGQ